MAPPSGIKSEALFQILFDKSADAIFVLSPLGVIERANQVACDRLQYSHDELVGRAVLDFHGPQTRELVPEILQTLRDTGSVRADVVHRAKDGTLIPTEINSHVVEIDGEPHILTTARDISERKRAEERARESTSRYQMLFEHSGTANSIYDRDMRLVLSNEVAYELLGLAPEDLVGRTVEEIFGPELGPEIRRRGEGVLTTGTPDSNSRDVKLPGGTRWFHTSYRALTDEVGAVVGVQTISHDITELHLANERLHLTEKMESIGVLAGGIAHDFNNLLAGLSGHLDLARMHLKEGRASEALARLDKSGQVFDRAKSLTRQLLTFSKGGAPVREPHILGPLLREWAEFSLSGSDISLELDVATDLWLCDCDVLQISQVVDNLLINARQVTPPSGRVVLRAENVDRGAPFLAISVTDRGPGIPQETLEKIFVPFFTTKSLGSGLGLATSRSIVGQHGGSIEVQTALGQGTTFTVYLPAILGRRGLRSPLPYAEFQGSGSALIMDDEEAVRDSVGEILTSFGFRVTRARNGHDALAYDSQAREAGKPFGVALLDLTIPGGMGGMETAQKLGRQGCSAILLAMTGYSEHTGKENMEASGFQGVLTKPFSRRELSTVLSRVAWPA